MAKSPKSRDPVDELAALLRDRPAAIVDDLLREVRQRLAERDRGPDLAALSSLVVTVAGGGCLEVTDTSGTVRTLSDGEDLAIVPVPPARAPCRPHRARVPSHPTTTVRAASHGAARRR